MLLRPFITSLIFSTLLLSSVQAAQTCVSTSIPVSNQDVNAISGSSDTNIIAVADNAAGNGQIVIFDGTSWVTQTDPDIPNVDFNDVFVFDANNAVVVGDAGAVLLQVNDDWIDISISNQDYTTIWAYAANDIFIAGDNGRIYHYDGSIWSSNLGSGSNNDDFVDSWGDATYVYFLNNDGDVFRYTRSPLQLDPLLSPNPINPGCSGNIDYNGFTNDGAGNFYLFGENQTPNPDEGVIFKWDGVNGSCGSSVFNTSSTDDINAISINPDGTFTAVGDDGVVVTSPDGTTWTEISSGGEDINAIYTLSNGSSIFGADNGSNRICTDTTPHFSIIHDGFATTCAAEAIKIQFHDTNHAIGTNYTGTININTSSGNGNWSLLTGTNTASFTDNGNGSASYTFVAGDNDEIVLSLASTTEEILNLNISDGTYSEFLTEDTNLTFSASGASSFSYIDNFSSQAYNNSDGSADWSLTPWTEINDNNIADSGRVRINGSERLRIGGNNDNRGISRQLDLSAAASATLSFSYRRRSLDNGGEYVTVQISSDGTTWNILDTFKGPQNDANFVTTSYPIDAQYFTANTQIRFLGNSLDAGAGADRVLFDDVNITATTASLPCAGLHHIEFIHDTSALTCNPESITLKACATADCSTLVTTSVTASLLPTGWVGGDSKTFTGTANYNLKHTIAETITLSTSSTTPVASNLVVCKDSGGTVISCDIVFSDSGFIFYNDTDVNTIIPTQLSGKDSNVGYNEKTLTLQAVKKSDNDPAQCAATFQNKTLNIDFAAECKNPGSCIAGQSFALNGIALTATTNNDLLSGSSSYDTRSITFDASGKYNIVFNYPEAGLIELHARHNILLADGTTPSGNYMSGSSSFVVRPLGISLDVLGQRAADYADNSLLDDSTGSNFSFAADASGSVFKKAGEAFTTTLTAVQWQAADDTNNDGIADSGANLSNNITTQNFGKETTAVVPANVILTQTTTLANAGTLTNSTNSTSFINGVGTKTIALTEVGIFDLTATLNSYLAADNIVTLTPSFGRFVPDHFDTLVTHACNTFSYSGQPFIVTVTSRNNSGDITGNYRGNFAHGVTLTDANPAGTPTGTFANNIITTTSFSSDSVDNGASFGVGSTEVANNFTYTFTTKETVPDTIEIRATDSNDAAISSSGFTEGSTEIRSGRTRVENSFGSELVDMPVTTQVEYYTNNGFTINSNDTCSTVNVTLTDIGTDPIELGTGAGQTCIWDDAGNSIGGTDFTCTADASKPQFSEPASTGSFNINLKSPGADNTGDIGITLNSPTWLKYDWDGDGADDDESTGVASFGLYRGDDRVIYWREVF